MNADHKNHESRTDVTTAGDGVRGDLAAAEPQVAARKAFPKNAKSPRDGAARKRSLRRTAAGVVALIAGLASAAYYFQCVAPYESTDNAFIEGCVVPVSSQVPGRVAELLIRDNQAVKAGDVLLKIDSRDFETVLAQARASVAVAYSQVDQALARTNACRAKVAQAQASAAAAEAESQRAADDLKRYESVESRAVSKQARDMVQSQARASGANLEAARSQVSAAEAEVALSEAGVQTARAAVEQAEAGVRQAELNLSYTQVAAQDDGRVTRRVVEEGAYIQPGQALMAIVPCRYWVVANFKETQLTHMRVGQPVDVIVDAYPDRSLRGHVDSIQSGAGARFSLFPPENATGNYIKVVQRVPVKIVLDDAPEAGLALGPGMSVVPKVRVK